jgi:hypothetical protein
VGDSKTLASMFLTSFGVAVTDAVANGATARAEGDCQAELIIQGGFGWLGEIG